MVKSGIKFYQKGSVEIVDGKGTHRFPYHTHESFMVGVVKSGKVKFNIRNKEYGLVDNDTYIIPPNVGMSIVPETPYRYLTICINNGIEKRLRLNKPGRFVIRNMGEKVIGLCEDFKSGKLSNKNLIGKLSELLDFRTDNKEFYMEHPSVLVNDAVNYIKENVNNKFSLDGLAKSVHLSKFYLIRIFKREMDVTPKQYDLQCKIRQVRKKVLKEVGAADIAGELNFSNQSHLCSVFRRYMGISMNNYRLNVQKSEQ